MTRKAKAISLGACANCGRLSGEAEEELRKLSQRLEVILRVMRMQARKKERAR